MKKLNVKKSVLRKGFTLIEIMISMVLFVIFMGIVSTSYVSIVRTQREQNEIRKMYADVRGVVDTLSEEIRLSAVDYDCYAGTNVGFNNPCPVGDVQGTLQNGRSPYLALVRKDGLEKSVFFFDKGKLWLKKFAKNAGGGFDAAPGYAGAPGGSGPEAQGFRSLFSDVVSVDNLTFAIFPDVNPYSSDSKIYSNNATQFQPKVTIFMKVKNGVNIHSNFNLDFQTTISSRVYS